MEKLDNQTLENLKNISKKVRRNLVRMHHETNAPHIGSGLSIVEMLVALYFRISNVNKKNVSSKDRDRIVLSKGHAAAALYSVLKEKGILSEKELFNFYKNGQYLAGHPSIGVKGVEVSSGSLGHGFPMAIGFALANKLDKKNYQVYAILGDGECNEGAVLESAIIAMRLKLDNLTIVVDCNCLQGYDYTKDICPIERLTEVWKSMGFYVIEIDGHDFRQLDKALNPENKIKEKPKVVIAKTVKGKGISFMENRLEWHYKSPNDEQLQKAMDELK